MQYIGCLLGAGRVIHQREVIAAAAIVRIEAKIRLVGDGPFYTPLIQTLLAENRYRQLRGKMVAEAQTKEIYP